MAAFPQNPAPVLIVDDDDDGRDAMAFMLELEGFTVRTATNGAEGLREMRVQPMPCVVLLDLHMPVMDGAGFREEQRKSRDLMAVPVILYSAHSDVRSAAEQLGIRAYFQKPADLTKVVALIRRWAT
jgi:DNA-binding NtrC family response regulator